MAILVFPTMQPLLGNIIATTVSSVVRPGVSSTVINTIIVTHKFDRNPNESIITIVFPAPVRPWAEYIELLFLKRSGFSYNSNDCITVSNSYTGEG